MVSADWSCTCKLWCVNTWSDTLWNQLWSYTVSQNSPAEGFLLRTRLLFLGKKKKKKKRGYFD